jgi:hypothetical protein
VYTLAVITCPSNEKMDETTVILYYLEWEDEIPEN